MWTWEDVKIGKGQKILLKKVWKIFQGIDIATADKPWSCIFSKHTGPGDRHHHSSCPSFVNLCNWQNLKKFSLTRLFDIEQLGQKRFLKIGISWSSNTTLFCLQFSLSVWCFLCLFTVFVSDTRLACWICTFYLASEQRADILVPGLL